MNKATARRPSKASEDVLFQVFEQVMGEGPGIFGEREAVALQVANELVRRWAQSELRRLSRQYDAEVIVDGRRYRRHATGVGRYHTLCGAVEVRRDSYRQVGVHNGPTVVPLELAAGIVENATPALAASVLEGFAMMPLRDYQDEMRAAHRVIPSRSTLERIAKRTGAAMHAELPTLEPVVRAREVVPRKAHAISVGLDRTTVPIAEMPDDIRLPPTRAHVRRRLPPVTVAYRMAYVATVAVHDRRGDTLKSTRIAAAAHEGASELMERLGAELHHLLRQRPRLPTVVVQDGAPELWNLVDAWLENFLIQPTMRLIDRYHVNERLAVVAEAVEREPTERHLLLERWCKALDRSDTAIRRICKQLDERLYGPVPDGYRDDDEVPWGRPRLMSGQSARLVEGHVAYFENHAPKIRYATARKRGFPIGSGVTEGACKSVIAVRFKRSGQRWFEPGVSSCLHLRTMHLNQRLRPSFHLFLQQHRERLVAH
jgi:hypothetical protein